MPKPTRCWKCKRKVYPPSLMRLPMEDDRIHYVCSMCRNERMAALGYRLRYVQLEGDSHGYEWYIPEKEPQPSV